MSFLKKVTKFIVSQMIPTKHLKLGYHKKALSVVSVSGSATKAR